MPAQLFPSVFQAGKLRHLCFETHNVTCLENKCLQSNLWPTIRFLVVDLKDFANDVDLSFAPSVSKQVIKLMGFGQCGHKMP